MTIDPSVHREMAAEANNSTWEILGKPIDQISRDDADEMTRRAYAAAYHWQRAEGSSPANMARAEWLLSRVWAVRANGEFAMHHAQRCHAMCVANGLVDFDLAYAHESLARAHACLGSVEEAMQHRELARGVAIADPEDKQLVDGDIAAEPWFGL